MYNKPPEMKVNQPIKSEPILPTVIVVQRVDLRDLAEYMQQHPSARIVAQPGAWPVVEVKA
jgi:hypothetical protein